MKRKVYLKFITLTGGLGNQMFIYAFCLELRARGLHASLFRHRASKKYGYQGYELKKLFNVREYETFNAKLFGLYLSVYFILIRLFSKLTKKKIRTKMLSWIGIVDRTVEDNFIYYPGIFSSVENNELYSGTWQSEHYFQNVKSKVRQTYIFNEKLISQKTKNVLNLINNSESVSIHIRRGDYLNSSYIDGFSNICSLEYYERAISLIKEKINNLRFFVFSDDQDWVRKNLLIENAEYITHNVEKDSWQDMYLMSKCKHNIIANSSFSWWGAWLNENKEKIVIAPKLWWSFFEKDDVVPEPWLRI